MSGYRDFGRRLRRLYRVFAMEPETRDKKLLNSQTPRSESKAPLRGMASGFYRGGAIRPFNLFNLFNLFLTVSTTQLPNS